MVMLLAAWLLATQMGTGQNVMVSAPPGVVLEVTMPSGSVNRLTIRSGAHGSVGTVNGPGLDVSPTLRDDGSLEIVVTPVAWDPATNCLTTGDAERQVLRPGQTTGFSEATFPIAVKWLGTVAPAVPSGASAADAGAERCCVACGSEVLCGCAVVTPCGDCAVAACSGQGGSIKHEE
jgi:hypothetical protein